MIAIVGSRRRKEGGQAWENFQARRRNYIGSEWNISSGALHPTKTRKTGCNQPLCFYPLPPPNPPSCGLLTGNLPRLLLTVLSLYSPVLCRSDGKSSFLFLASFPVFHPYSGCLVASMSSNSPFRSPTDQPFALTSLSLSLSIASLFHLKSGSKFVKMARAARGFGHLESLRLQNPYCCISSRTFSASSRQEGRN